MPTPPVTTNSMSALVSAEVRTARKFTDIPFAFNINPFTRDLVKKRDEDAIKASIYNLVRTKKYERPFHPEISSDVESLMFENFTPITAAVLKKSIEDVIKFFEPRAKLLDVKIDGSMIDSNEVRVVITFAILNSAAPVTVTVPMTRTR